MNITFSEVFHGFHSNGMTVDEFEKMIKDIMSKKFPSDPIKKIEYEEDSADVYLESGEIIKIEVDWNEIILI